ncbi:MAG: DUF2147 domain-containing protein [Chitinispirillia bacterium]
MKYFFINTVCLLFFPVYLFGSHSDKIVGIWLTSEGESKIEIYKVNSFYHGKIIWLKEPNNEKGKPKLDDKNPDVSLRTRTLLDLELLKDLEFKKKGLWENGRIYDPETGNIYKCKATMKNDSTLHFRGFIGVALLGRTTVWTKVK